MTRLFLAAGVAALAIAAPAASDPGGKANKGQSAKVERGGGGKAQARAERRSGNSEARAERRSGPRVEQGNRGNDRREVRVERRSDRADRRAARAEQRQQREDKRIVRAQRIDDRGDRRRVRAANRDNRDRDVVRISGNDRDFARARVRDLDDWFVPGRGAPIALGCPPGLAAKAVPCVPPGQVNKRLSGTVLPAAYRDNLLPLGLRDYYRDDDDYMYRLGEGYVYRVDRDSQLIAALLPLIGGGLGLGQMFPTSYMNSYVPDYYRSFYPDSQDDYYRYSNGYVYEIDRDTGMIEDIIPQYGYGYGMGQMLPPSYSYYNVPQQYRSFYPQTDTYSYRYAPGAIYQVDRGTNLITAVASLLAGDLAVGQRLPMGYSAYNVPLSYRDRYYDTADNWYRYNDGYIYQVDPTTRLITAVISALV
jgi:hypothetical protein